MAQVRQEIREYAESFVIAVLLALFIILFVAQSFLVQGDSMEPSLHHGERLLVDKVTYRFRPPERGEIIVFSFPKDPRRKFIKRVIGVPGDTVEIRNRTLFINGIPIEEDYIRGPMYQPYGPVVVPEGTVWVLGDNRNNSEDSRFPDVGPVPLDLVVGRAVVVYWPLREAGLIAVPRVLADLE
ncbi:MAG: signal peptidase I [Clostridia bacterium]|nr:signal peptidase I [Bacillota bacterium]MBO2520293.1 signal peptidase I [Bacillota bacterium]